MDRKLFPPPKKRKQKIENHKPTLATPPTPKTLRDPVEKVKHHPDFIILVLSLIKNDKSTR